MLLRVRSESSKIHSSISISFFRKLTLKHSIWRLFANEERAATPSYLVVRAADCQVVRLLGR